MSVGRKQERILVAGEEKKLSQDDACTISNRSLAEELASERVTVPILPLVRNALRGDDSGRWVSRFSSLGSKDRRGRTVD
jgi:hypothetical protein